MTFHSPISWPTKLIYPAMPTSQSASLHPLPPPVRRIIPRRFDFPASHVRLDSPGRTPLHGVKHKRQGRFRLCPVFHDIILSRFDCPRSIQLQKIIKTYLPRQLRLGLDNFPSDHLPPEVTVSRYQSCILRAEPILIVVQRVSIRLERHRAVLVPLEHQLPVFRVGLTQEAELVNALVVAEPTPAARCCRVDRGQQAIFFAELAAVRLIPSSFDQRQHVSGLCVAFDSFRLIRRYTQVLDGICTCAPSTARCGKGLCVPVV